MSLGFSNLNTTREELSQLLKKNRDSWGHHPKKCIYALIAREKVILWKPAGIKAVGKKVKVQNRRRDPSLRRRKGKKRQMQAKKVPVMENKMDLLHSSILTV